MVVSQCAHFIPYPNVDEVPKNPMSKWLPKVRITHKCNSPKKGKFSVGKNANY